MAYLIVCIFYHNNEKRELTFEVADIQARQDLWGDRPDRSVTGFSLMAFDTEACAHHIRLPAPSQTDQKVSLSPGLTVLTAF